MITDNILLRYKKNLKSKVSTSLFNVIRKVQSSYNSKQSDGFNEFILYESNLLELNSKHRKGLLSEVDYTLIKNQIISKVIWSIDNIASTEIHIVQSKNFVLDISKFDGNFFSFFLLDGDCIRIGRNADNDICLDEKIVSRYHCELHISLPNLKLIDLKSKNKTFIDGEVVNQKKLSTQMSIRIGNSELFLTDKEETE